MTKGLTRVYVGLGSNLGDRAAMLKAAEAAIAQLRGVEVLRGSKVHHSKALRAPGDATPQPDYLNSVLELSCQLSVAELLGGLKQIERAMGRGPGKRWAARIIDLDLLLYGNVVLHQPGIEIPHPGMVTRRFVLVPLAELAPELRHPVLGLSIAALLDVTPFSDE